MATWNYITKNVASWASIATSGIVFYITTDTPDFILVGSSETDFLVWQDATTWDYQTKN